MVDRTEIAAGCVSEVTLRRGSSGPNSNASSADANGGTAKMSRSSQFHKNEFRHQKRSSEKGGRESR